MKDIAAPERLYELAGDGFEAGFPPLKTLGAASTLPVPVTALVGREVELDDLASALGSPGVRLVTLTGPGGTGKTRLAVGLAHAVTTSYPDGVYFAGLAAVTTAQAMWASIGETMDVPSEPPAAGDLHPSRTVGRPARAGQPRAGRGRGRRGDRAADEGAPRRRCGHLAPAIARIRRAGVRRLDLGPAAG